MMNLKQRLCLFSCLSFFLSLLPTGAYAVTAGFLEKGTASLYISAGMYTHHVRIVIEKATRPPEGPDVTLSLKVDSCVDADRCIPMFFSKKLKDSAFTISDNGESGELKTSFGGLPMKIHWSKGSNEGGLWSDIGVPGARVGSGGLADVHVGIFGMGCKARGELMRIFEINNNALAFQAGLVDPGIIPLKGFRGIQPSCSPVSPRLKNAQPPVTRTERILYDIPGGVSGVHGVQSSDHRIGGISMSTSDNENYISVEIQDASGEPVYAYIGQDLNGDQQYDEYQAICGETKTPIRIEQGHPLAIEIHAGPCLYPVIKPARATWGVIKVTLSNSSTGAIR